MLRRKLRTSCRIGQGEPALGVTRQLCRHTCARGAGCCKIASQRTQAGTRCAVCQRGVLEEGTSWAFADQGSYKMSLRKVKKNYKAAKSKATQLKKIIQKEFTEESQFEQFCNAIYNPSEEELEWMEELSKIEVL